MNHCTFSLLPLPSINHKLKTPTTEPRLALHIALKRVLQHPRTKLQAYMGDLSEQDVPGSPPGATFGRDQRHDWAANAVIQSRCLQSGF